MSYTARIQYIIKALIKKDGITLKQIAEIVKPLEIYL